MAYVFGRETPDSKVWWVSDDKKHYDGIMLFTFDKKKIYSLFQDYPQALTPEEKEIYDKEEPYWAEFFKQIQR